MLDYPLDEKAYEQALASKLQDDEEAAYQENAEKVITLVGRALSLSETFEVLQAGQMGGMMAALSKYEELLSVREG